MKQLSMMDNSHYLEMAPFTFEKSSTSENQKSGLRVKRSIHLPNEIWLKIMNYLKTKDIFERFALVNKLFNQLTLDTGSIKYLQVKNIGGNLSKHENMMKVLSRCKTLIEFSIEDRFCDEYQFMSCIIKALESSQKLKSLKILTKCYVTLGTRFHFGGLNSKFLNFLEKSKDKLENIEFEEVRFTHEVLDIICKMKNLKRLAIKRNLIFSNFIENLANSENQLEAIELHQKFSYPHQEEDKALNKLLSKKQDTLKSIILTNLGCCPILTKSYFPKL